MKNFIHFSVLVILVFIIQDVNARIVPPDFSVEKENLSRIQEICDGDVTLSSQSEVDAFHCTVVTGALTISGADITNVDALSSLERAGSLSINGTDSLTNVDGLKSLKSITGGSSFAGLLISGNAMLSNIDGLSSLSEIANGHIYSINIGSNPALRNIDGLSSVTTLPGTLLINDNQTLENIDGLKNLVSLTYSTGTSVVLLGITDNPALLNLDGLSSLKSVHGHDGLVIIESNASLADVDGLSALESVTGNRNVGFEIKGNPLLKNLDGLSALTTLAAGFSGYLAIENNATLENIDGLSSIMSAGGRPLTIYITDNPELTGSCGLFPYISGVLGYNYPLEMIVYGNGADFSKEEILAGGPCLDFAADKTMACADSEVTFTFSCPVPVDNLQWNFGEGAIPATAVGEGPHTVTYGTPGIKTVVLMPDSFPVLTKAGYVTVNPAPADKALITLAPLGPEGHATSIIVVAPQPETQYQLRYDVDDSPVWGSLPDTDTLATGALYISTTFNVLASNEITGCVAEMSTKVTVTIDPSLKPGTTAQLLAKATRHDSGDDIDIYPNPGDGNFDLIISNDYEGPIHCQIRRVTGQVVVNEMLSKSGDVFEKNYDLTELHGVYLLSVRFTGGEDNGIVRYRRLLIRK